MKVLFGIFYGKPPFGALLKRSRDDMDGLGGPHGGPPRGVAGHTWGSTLLPLLFLGFTLMPLRKDFIHVPLGFNVKPPYPLGFPINRGGGAALHSHPFSHTSDMHDLASLSLPAK